MTSSSSNHDHLAKTTTDRGFDWMPAVRGTHADESITVYESSSATGPRIWLKSTSIETPMDEHGKILGPAVPVVTTVELDALEAWRLAEQIMTLAKEHYQGDARPSIDVRNADIIQR